MTLGTFFQIFIVRNEKMAFEIEHHLLDKFTLILKIYKLILESCNSIYCSIF